MQFEDEKDKKISSLLEENSDKAQQIKGLNSKLKASNELKLVRVSKSKSKINLNILI